MSDIIESYQEEKSLEKTPEPTIALATVSTNGNDGVSVVFDGESEASTKKYPKNITARLAVGDRVLMQKINGNYVALCPLGNTDRPLPDPPVQTPPDLSVVRNYSSYFSLNAGMERTGTLSFSKSGYKAIGVVGWDLDFNSGTYPVILQRCEITSGFGSSSCSVSYTIHNASSSTVSNIILYVSVLFAKEVTTS